MNMLEVVRKRCQELIMNILENDNCFFEMDLDTSYNILADLNFEQDQIKKLYLNLIKKENEE